MGIKSRINSILEPVLVTLMGVLVIDVLWQVLARYFFPFPTTLSEELARYLLVWVGLLGASYVTGKNRHVSIELLITKLKPPYNNYLFYFINLIVFLFALVVMVYGGSRMVFGTMGQASPALRIPMGYIYLAIPISGLLMMAYSVLNVLELWSKNNQEQL